GGSDGDERRHDDGAQDDLEIGAFEKLSIGNEGELVHHCAREVIERIEALQQQCEKRADIDDADPQEGRKKQHQRQKRRAAEEEIRHLDEGTAATGRDRRHHGSSISTGLALSQTMRTLSLVANWPAPDGIAAANLVSPAAMTMLVTALKQWMAAISPSVLPE